jgi:hypothetical protein
MINMICTSYYITGMMILSVAGWMIYSRKMRIVVEEVAASEEVEAIVQETKLSIESTCIESNAQTAKSESLEYCLATKIVKTRLMNFK